MSYQLPLSERIRIQFEILCENCADCFASLSGSYKKPMFFMASCAFLLTLRSAKRSISKIKSGGGLLGYGSSYSSGYGSSGYSSGYGGSSYGTSSSLTGGSSSMYGGYNSGASTGGGLMGGTSSSYGVRGATGMSSGYGGSTYGSTMGGTSSFGSTLGGGGKGTATLVDSNPSGVIAMDPSIRFFDYGGTTDFYGQIEAVQCFDAASFVSQILSQPGQSKVLVVDGGGSQTSALFDSEMANTAMRNGWKGVVVYGAVRDAAKLANIQFGVKALGTNPIKGSGMNGQRGVGVSIGSTQVQSGLWLYADMDGIVMSQTDVSGGSFGGGSSGSSFGTGGMGSSFGTGGGGYGASSSLTGGYGASSSGGYGASSSLTGGYGSSSSMTGGYGGSSSLTGGYGASSSLTGGYGGSSSLTGGYGSTSSMGGSTYGTGTTTGYGGSTYGGSSSYGSSSYGSTSPYSYGRSSYSYSSRRKKHKMFKILLATSIAAIVWIICLR